MGGIVGRLLHEFAITITAAILISGFVSISLTPMLCSRFLHPPRDQRHGRLYWLFERVFDSWRGLYSQTLRVSLKYRFITAAVSLVLMVATVYLFIAVPKGFLPSEDQGRFNVNTEGAQGISFDEMVRHQLQVADVLLQDPNIASAGVNVGQMGNNATGGSNQGRMFVELKPKAQREMSVDEVIASLRPKLAEIPGIRTFMVNQPPINLGGGGQNRALYQFTMQDTDTAELYKWAPIFEAQIRQTPGFEDVNSDLQLNNPQVTVEMNRDKLSTLGLSATQVENALYNAYGTRQVSQIYAPNNQYQVILRVAPEFQRDPAAMSLLYIRSSSERLIPLESVARMKTEVGPFQVNHFGQLPAVTIAFNLAPGFALGDAVNQIQTWPRRRCPPRSIWRSRARRRRSRIRCAASGSCSHSRSSSSTSCSACCMKASRTRSPFCPASRLPASVRC